MQQSVVVRGRPGYISGFPRWGDIVWILWRVTDAGAQLIPTFERDDTAYSPIYRRPGYIRRKIILLQIVTSGGQAVLGAVSCAGLATVSDLNDRNGWQNLQYCNHHREPHFFGYLHS